MTVNNKETIEYKYKYNTEYKDCPGSLYSRNMKIFIKKNIVSATYVLNE